MKKIRCFLKSSSELKKMLLKVFFLTFYYRCLIKYIPFSKTAWKLGKKDYEVLINADENQIRQIYLLKKALRMICRHTPWQSLCLVQAYTAKYFLRKWRIPTTVYMGVCKDKNGNMQAHAWTRCANIFITGGNGEQSYTVTGIFGE